MSALDDMSELAERIAGLLKTREPMTALDIARALGKQVLPREVNRVLGACDRFQYRDIAPPEAAGEEQPDTLWTVERENGLPAPYNDLSSLECDLSQILVAPAIAYAYLGRPGVLPATLEIIATNPKASNSWKSMAQELPGADDVEGLIVEGPLSPLARLVVVHYLMLLGPKHVHVLRPSA